MREKRDLMSHGLLVVSSLFMLIAVTVAWFINSTTVGTNQMSFAAQSADGNLQIYAGTATDRAFDKTAQTLTHTVTWEETPAEKASFSIQHMVPGECRYFLITSGSAQELVLSDVKLFDAQDQGVTAGREDLLMTQCLSLYLLDLNTTQSVNGQEKDKACSATIALTRLDNDMTKQLENACFRGEIPTGIPGAPNPAVKQYVLAIYCDPLYGQNMAPLPNLDGRISFSVTLRGES